MGEGLKSTGGAGLMAKAMSLKIWFSDHQEGEKKDICGPIQTYD